MTTAHSDIEDPLAPYRPRLFGLAYRMLGTRSDADDVLQDAWLRWRQADDVDNAEAWLVTAVTRLSIDRLRKARTERESYRGPWLPEPLAESEIPPPTEAVELANDVSLAFLAALERLSPEERAALLLKDVFDYDYDEIATLVQKNAAACRQSVHRARERVRASQPRFAVAPDAHARLLARFLEAARDGSHERVVALLADDARISPDSGGKVVSVKHELQGADRIGRLFAAVARLIGDRMEWRLAPVNGELGIHRYLDGQLHSVLTIVSDGERIVEILQVMNPDKLRGIA